MVIPQSCTVYLSRSQLKREQICQTSKSDQQEWQSLVVLNGTKIFLNGTNIYFLKYICGNLKRGMANSFWNQWSKFQVDRCNFRIYSNLWKIYIFSGNIYSLKSNTYFWGTVMFVQYVFLYLIVTRHKLTVSLFQKNLLLVASFFLLTSLSFLYFSSCFAASSSNSP